MIGTEPGREWGINKFAFNFKQRVFQSCQEFCEGMVDLSSSGDLGWFSFPFKPTAVATG